MEWIRGEFRVSTDPSLLDLDTIEAFLRRSYWAPTRPREAIGASIQNSLCFGLYHGARLVGFCRAVTDYATFYWLCDVFVDEAYRGQGLGAWLVECAVESPPLRSLRGILATRDAHGLYARFGYEAIEEPANMMMRRPTASSPNP